MVKAYIFDLDGTLLNTDYTIGYALNKALRAHGYPEIDVNHTKNFIGGGARTLIRTVLSHVCGGSDPVERAIEDCLATFSAAYESEPSYLTEPYDGIASLVKELKARGMKLGVMTNKNDNVSKFLVKNFFSGIFDEVSGAKEGIPLKPCPQAPLELCSSLGVLPSEVVYVGDMDIDVKTGKNFGAAVTAGVLWGFGTEESLKKCGADVIISSPSQLLRFCV